MRLKAQQSLSAESFALKRDWQIRSFQIFSLFFWDAKQVAEEINMYVALKKKRKVSTALTITIILEKFKSQSNALIDQLLCWPQS